MTIMSMFFIRCTFLYLVSSVALDQNKTKSENQLRPEGYKSLLCNNLLQYMYNINVNIKLIADDAFLE